MSNDRFAPKLTCKDSSTVDYFISSACIFEQISEFEIHEFSNLYSDAHCSLKLSLNISLAVNDSSKITEVPDLTESPKLWDASKADLFVENFDIPRVAEIETMLFRLQDKQPSAICKDDIDSIINDIGSLFIHCSKDTFGYKKQKPESRYSKFKPWFNRECINARNLYHKVRKTYNQHKNEYYKNMLKNVSKKYKNTLKLHSDKYKIERIQKLRNLKSNNPKEYWRVINSEKKKNNVTAPLNDFYEFYKQINSGANSENEDDGDTDINDFLQNCNFDNEFQTILENEINQKISANEISTAIKSLRNNKSPGIDNIVNEHLKTTVNIMLPIYVKLFNIIFDTGIIPECWTLGTIKPIYKDKGNIREPGNYRPITLLSCFGKVFTAIINNRLNKFSDKHGLIHWEQAGFRKNFSTTDNLFVLKSLIDFVQSQKKKLYCCFIDFQQAFDTVWRAGLWRKLIQTGIMGKCFNLIFNMYKDIKSKVVTNEGSSSFFECNVGVRQGENLSPFLFSIYLNDLENFLRCNKASGVECEVNGEDTLIYLKLLILLYADDTVIFSDRKHELQTALNAFKTYCTKWKLKVNTTKTKIVTFSKGKPDKNSNFTFQNQTIEVVNEYKYLGIYFGRTGSYVSAKKHIAEQANKAIFALMKKIRHLDLPLDIQIDLFNKTIKPILLYGCELWGIGNIDIIERVQMKFYKQILGLKKSTPSNFIYGELGINPLYIDIQTRMISFWTKLIENNATDKLSSTVYNIIYEMHNANKIRSPWIEKVKTILCSLGFSAIWYSQSFTNAKWLTKAVNRKIKDIFIQTWLGKVEIESESNVYRLFKSSFEQSEYIAILEPSFCKTLLAFRTRNHKLPIEIGRWRGIPYNERKCPYCANDVGDEYHMVLVCKLFQEERAKYVKPYYYRYPNILKFQQLMNSTNKKILLNLCKLVKTIMKRAASQ
ncbi:MAG: reverse transcriptase family protein [Candidatus Thiodiazotropha endolucinida]|nr:reverse transcriptase family protein [Candidatus Thiodiazotropha taylori]MCW4264514.1 reverse transcriptase family protein [Candidatus Thiodiazotropha endolucinida]